MTSQKRKQVLKSAFLEDPVYTLWVSRNLYDIKVLFKLDPDYFPEFYKTFGNSMDIFVRAFKGTEEEDIFLSEYLDDRMKRQYQDCSEYIQEGAAAQGARSLILEKLHVLQDQNVIQDLDWKIPGLTVLAGIKDIPIRGPFRHLYENGDLALEGQYEEKLREGQWKHYYLGAKIMAIGHYHMGEKVDLWTFYYPSGQKQAEGQYKDDLMEGDWVEWSLGGIGRAVQYKRGRSL